MTDRQKILDRLAKLRASAESEAKIGNSEAAEAFAAMFNKMLLQHELEESDVDRHAGKDTDPIIMVRTNWMRHWRPGLRRDRFMPGNRRIFWQEQFAVVIAKYNFCRVCVDSHEINGVKHETDTIFFVGTKLHAETAEYLYTMLVLAAYDLCEKDYGEIRKQLRSIGASRKEVNAHMKNYRESWFTAFVRRISIRLEETRRQVVAEAPQGESQALLRLNQAMVKVNDWMDKNSGSIADEIQPEKADNPLGWDAGDKAGKRVPIGKQPHLEGQRRTG